MSDVLQIPGRARVALGSFVAGAGVVGLAWALTTRTSLPSPPEPRPFVLQSQPAPNSGPSTELHQTTETPTETVSDAPVARPTGTLTPEQWAQIGPTYHPSPAPERPADMSSNENSDSSESFPVVYLDEYAARNSEAEEQEESATEPLAPRATAVQLIEINRADAAELELLPGIGPVLARRIVDDRTANGPFRNAGDLQRVRGIGEKTAAKLSPMITFD